MQRIAITGANRGIGLELARQFSARGDQVFAICRQADESLDQTNISVVDGIDVTNAEQRRDLRKRLAAALDGDPLDILIHCAGLLSRQSLEDLDEPAMLDQFRVNALAPLQLTAALLDLLKTGSKVGIVSSRMGSIEDNTSGRHYGYRMSKAAANAAGKSLALDLAERGIAVAVLHPGYVRTRMTGFTGYIDPDESAAGLIARMDKLSPETSGRFWHADGSELPW